MIKNHLLKEIGGKVREKRIELNMTQEQLATKAKVHRTYIGMIERAEKNITIVNLKKISDALGINIKDLL